MAPDTASEVVEIVTAAIDKFLASENYEVGAAASVRANGTTRAELASGASTAPAVRARAARRGITDVPAPARLVLVIPPSLRRRDSRCAGGGDAPAATRLATVLNAPIPLCAEGGADDQRRAGQEIRPDVALLHRRGACGATARGSPRICDCRELRRALADASIPSAHFHSTLPAGLRLRVLCNAAPEHVLW